MPTLVLVHGLSGSSRWWSAVVPRLRRHVDVKLLDVPRFDRTFRPTATVAWLEKTIAPWAPVVLVGHSLGGLACARLAARRTDLVAGLVLIAPVGMPSRGVVGHGLPLARAILSAPPRFLALLAADALRAGPESVVRGALHAVGARLRDDVEAIEVPTLLLWGGRDPLVPVEQSREWQRLLPHAQLEILPDAGHVPMVEAVEPFVEALERFVDEVGDTARVRPVRGVPRPGDLDEPRPGNE